jgi:hypothetical protein
MGEDEVLVAPVEGLLVQAVELAGEPVREWEIHVRVAGAPLADAN